MAESQVVVERLSSHCPHGEVLVCDSRSYRFTSTVVTISMELRLM